MRVFAMLVATLTLAGCVSRQDTLDEAPMLDQVFQGDFRAVGPCVVSAIQTADYTISPNVSFIPSPTWSEIQTTASSAYTGTIYGQITRLTDIDGKSFRAVVRSVLKGDGEVAVNAVRGCAN